MPFGLAAASLIIAFFAVFIVWGRSAGGQQTLLRVFGPARTPQRTVKTTRRRASSGKTSSRGSKTSGSKTSGSKSGTGSRSRRATKR